MDTSQYLGNDSPHTSHVQNNSREYSKSQPTILSIVAPPTVIHFNVTTESDERKKNTKNEKFAKKVEDVTQAYHYL